MLFRTDATFEVVEDDLSLAQMQGMVGDSRDPEYTSLIEYCPVVEGAEFPANDPITGEARMAWVRDVIADEEGRLRENTATPNVLATYAVFQCVPPHAPFWIVGDVIIKLRMKPMRTQEEEELPVCEYCGSILAHPCDCGGEEE